MIIGAKPVLEKDEITGLDKHVKDKKGRYMWEMPEPVATVQHKRRVKVPMQFGDKVIRVPQTEMVDVPVYRGYPRSLIRYMRSQRAFMKRQYEKKLAEDLARQEAELEEAANATP